MNDPAAVFSDSETAWHRAARLDFVPWVARLLGGGSPLRGESEALPAGMSDALTAESVNAVGDIANRAVWRFLARDCGWRIRPVVDFSGPENGEGKFARRRLWQSEAGQQRPSLRFTPDAIDLLLGVFEHTRGETRLQAFEPAACADSNGDLFLHHLVFRQLISSAPALGVESDFHWGPWYQNPLNALFHVRSFLDDHAATPDWDRLVEPDLIAVLPWIQVRLVLDWRTWLHSARSDLDRTADWFGNLTPMMRSALASWRERPDLLIFFLDFLAAEATSGNQHAREFESRTAEFTKREREAASKPWAECLGLTEELEVLHRTCRDLHPVERGGPEKCFLAAWEEMTFSESADRLKSLRHRIRPALS